MNNPEGIEKLPLILVVDDDRLIRRLIRQAMVREGYEVIEAANGKEALNLYLSESPNIILLDAQMPVMDGFTCCHNLQRISQDSLEVNIEENEDLDYISQTDKILAYIDRTPVLMITALDDTDSVDKAFAVGATDYITKPINWAVLRQRVRHLLVQAQLYRQLELANNELKRLATLDGLTQLANRRRFDQYLHQQWRVMLRKQLPISLILCDVDFFKRYNDAYGHQAGDACLQKIAAAVSTQAKRPQDLVARYGGEELAVILPDSELEGVLVVAHRIREAVKNLKLEHRASEISDYVTLSIGVASLIPEDDSQAKQLIELADRALYQAKNSGRDRVSI